MTIRFSLVSLLLSLAFAGCSKKPLADATESAVKATPQTPNPELNADLAQVAKNMEAKQYDAAVGSLVALKQLAKTEAEQQAYAKQLQQVNGMLVERAAKGDEQAAQSYRVLGRFMTGR